MRGSPTTIRSCVPPLPSLPPAGAAVGDSMAQIGIDYVTNNADRLGEGLDAPYPYFGETFAVSADINLLERNGEDARTTTAGGILSATEEESPSMIIPVIAALIAVVLCCLISYGCFF